MVSHDPSEVRVVRRSVGVLCIQWWNTSMWCLFIVMHVKRGQTGKNRVHRVRESLHA